MRLTFEHAMYLTIVAIIGAFVVAYAGAFDSVRHPPGMTAINGDYELRESQRRQYRYASQAEVCNSLRYMNVILMDDDAREACRIASDGKPGFRLAEFWEKMREAGR